MSKFADLDQPGSSNNPMLSEIKRHGHFPPQNRPIGWDDEGYRKIFPTKDLPFQKVDEVPYSSKSNEGCRLIWGDNLAVMRSLPDECIDLIYIDPPFFSGRNYNLIFGDKDEERTFRDTWDGLETYLAWMNARIWEMKRLLKPTGSLFLHLDHHASHHVKVELDKMFGYENFRNEIIWHYGQRMMPNIKHLSRKHDSILWYTKSNNYKFKKITEPYDIKDVRSWRGTKFDEKGEYYLENGGKGKPRYKRYIEDIMKEGKPLDDVWNLRIVGSGNKERVGYPTQKPERLVERIVSMCTEPGDTVADFFAGGCTTGAVSQKLGRRWIACDISRGAIQVGSNRLSNISSGVGIDIPDEKLAFNFHHIVQYHGTYSKTFLQQYTYDNFKIFVTKCYEADPYRTGNHIHATKGNYALFIGPPNSEISHTHVLAFYKEMKDAGFRYGQLIGWKISAKAQEEIKRIRNSTREGEVRDIQAVTITMVDTDSDEFKGSNIRFEELKDSSKGEEE